MIQDGPKLVDFIIRNVFELTKGTDNEVVSDISSTTSVPQSLSPSTTQQSYSTLTTTTTAQVPPSGASTQPTLMIDTEVSETEDINYEVAAERQFNDISTNSVRHSSKYRDIHGLDFYFPDVLRAFFS